MSSDSPQDAANSDVQSDRPTGNYVVVARRYRPQSFEELVGQQQTSQALAGAIHSNRVGHAYLFTGARGVGKTSAARIFAKALNCVQGPSATPCNECDVCQSVSQGEDVDVLEIDGASNRGIDEIRQLRSNVSVRPSRARFKIYIIDEVHMLTAPAFNALLKTLEEPPEHVKFIFCTTDPEKIPITVLSRCQRFDFAPVETESIIQRLRHIVDTEGREADPEALRMLARRAGGSMRDSQSLLEQLLSFSSKKITVDDIHKMLGTARGNRLEELAARIADRDTAGVLAQVDASAAEGVDPGQLAEQLLGYFRDMMTVRVGCQSEFMLYTDPSQFEELLNRGKHLGLETTLAIAQILDTMLTKAKQSTHVRTLLEVALVRICNLEQLDSLPELIQQLSNADAAAATHSRPRPPATRSGGPGAPPATSSTASAESGASAATSGPAQKKKSAPGNVTRQAEGGHAKPLGFVAANVAEIWQEVISQLEDTAGQAAASGESVAISAPNKLVVRFKPEYTFDKERCQRPENQQKIEQLLSRITGQSIRIDFQLISPDSAPRKRPPRTSRIQQRRELEKHPFVESAMEMFDGEVTDVARRRGAS